MQWIPVIHLNTGYEVHESLRMPYFSYSIINKVVRFRGEIIRSRVEPAESNLICTLPDEIRPSSRIRRPIGSGAFLTTEGEAFLTLEKTGELSVLFGQSTAKRHFRFCSLIYLL